MRRTHAVRELSYCSRAVRHTHSGRQPPGSGRQLPGSGRMWLPNPFELTNIDKVCKCKMHIESTAARMWPTGFTTGCHAHLVSPQFLDSSRARDVC